MPWFRVDDTLAFHTRTVMAGNPAMGLWVRAGAWCAGHKSKDGSIPAAVLARLGSAKQIETLVSVGLLLEHPATDWFRLAGIDFFVETCRASIPAQIRQAVLERDGYACLTCGATDDLQMDHIHPWSLGGPDTFENLQTLCRACNSRKGARI